MHAADVLQSVYNLLIHTFLNERLTELEKIALFIATAIHDLAHPGLNNAFLLATKSPLSIIYNDKV